MFKKGNRLYSLSTLTLFLVATLHTLGIFRQSADVEEKAVIENMQHFTFQGMGMVWSIYDVLISVLLTMTALLLYMVVVSFFVLYSIPSIHIRRRLSLINALFMWLLVILYSIFQVPPPLVSFIVVGVLFTFSFILSGRRIKSAAEEE